MEGEVENVHQWVNAHVLVAPRGTALPPDAEAEWPGSWDPIGFLAGDEDMPENFEEQVNRFHEWSGRVVGESHRDQIITVEFTPIEWNDAVRELVWPGSDATKLRLGPPAEVLLGIELSQGSKVFRKITENYASIRRSGPVTPSPSQIMKYPLTATIFPDGETPPTYWTVQQAGLTVSS